MDADGEWTIKQEAVDYTSVVHQTSAFFRLPFELRCDIYEHLFVNVQRSKTIITRVDICSKAGVPHPLARTCRLFRADVLAIFLKNSFTAKIREFDTSHCEAWLSGLSNYNTNDLRLQIHWFPPLQGDDGPGPANPGQLRQNLLRFMRAIFYGRSHVFPADASKQWMPRDFDAGMLPTINSSSPSEYQSGQSLFVGLKDTIPKKEALVRLRALSIQIHGLRLQFTCWAAAASAVMDAINQSGLCDTAH